MSWANIPRWFLITVIVILIATGGPILTFAISNHLDQDVQQSNDIKALTANMNRVVEAIENLKHITENNRAEHRWLHSDRRPR